MHVLSFAGWENPWGDLRHHRQRGGRQRQLGGKPTLSQSLIGLQNVWGESRPEFGSIPTILHLIHTLHWLHILPHVRRTLEGETENGRGLSRMKHFLILSICHWLTCERNIGFSVLFFSFPSVVLWWKACFLWRLIMSNLIESTHKLGARTCHLKTSKCSVISSLFKKRSSTASCKVASLKTTWLSS